VDDPTQRCPDISLATRLLDWKPTIGLDQGLQRCIAYFDQVLRASA
jgi:UDP-glucuronate decarboxylase